MTNRAADADYMPVLHIDVYGTIGALFGNNNYAAMADYLAKLEELAKPFHLRIEGPMDCDCDRETQMEALAGLTAELDRRGIQRGAGGRRMVQHPGGHQALRRPQGRPHGPDQDP